MISSVQGEVTEIRDEHDKEQIPKFSLRITSRTLTEDYVQLQGDDQYSYSDVQNRDAMMQVRQSEDFHDRTNDKAGKRMLEVVPENLRGCVDMGTAHFAAKMAMSHLKIDVRKDKALDALDDVLLKWHRDNPGTACPLVVMNTITDTKLYVRGKAQSKHKKVVQDIKKDVANAVPQSKHRYHKNLGAVDPNFNPANVADVNLPSTLTEALHVAAKVHTDHEKAWDHIEGVRCYKRARTKGCTAAELNYMVKLGIAVNPDA